MDGYELKSLRESENLSREEFADKMYVDESCVREWEDYGFEPLDYEIRQMAEIFELDEDVLRQRLNLDEINSSDSHISLGSALLGLGFIFGMAALFRRTCSADSSEDDYQDDDKYDDEDEEEENEDNTETEAKGATSQNHTFFRIFKFILLLLICFFCYYFLYMS